MLSYKPVSDSRSCGECRRSRAGAGSSLIRQGLIEWYCCKNAVMSTIRSRMSGSPGNGLRTLVSGSARMLVMQARPSFACAVTPGVHRSRGGMERNGPERATRLSISVAAAMVMG